MDVISTRSLTKYYGKTKGVADLTMSVPQGAVYGFLGPNGAGKTTTIRCLLGMLKPTSGSATLLGEAVSLDGADLRHHIGYVAGEVRLYEKETGRWHMQYAAGFRGGKGRLADELLERFEFDPSRRVRELSKGNKQKLALILALAHDPELLILDEPTSGLDPLNQETVYSVIEERVAEGRTVFLSSHVLSEVERVCDTVGIIRGGQLVAEEGVKALLGKRLRQVGVEFAEPVDPALLAQVPGVDNVTAISATSLTARARGDAVDALIKRVAERQVLDLHIQQASLEDVFLEYYRDTAEPVAAEGGEE
ncbi:MAG: ABC transporter ATP-binding protein [Coriobacteriia bacterium]|nr:ABC transporter ATP-binding protein [Coriobacteriia bacterium]MBN2847499.1 ABC transporter ATP-binding protein [Coriobacteriia bacterium]